MCVLSIAYKALQALGPPAILESRCFSIRIVSFWLICPDFKASRSCILMLSRKHDEDMYAADWVGINSVSQVLLVFLCQQDEYPWDHILLLGSSLWLLRYLFLFLFIRILSEQNIIITTLLRFSITHIVFKYIVMLYTILLWTTFDRKFGGFKRWNVL